MRLAPLGRYVTPDEPTWVYRSIRFADALSDRDWAAIPPTGHPGVTTMWLGAAGVTMQRLLDPAGSAAHLDWIRRLDWLSPENGAAFRRLAFFLPWGRVAVALVTTLGLVILYPLLARLFDQRVALLAVGLLAFDPFLTGHSGLLHTDALVAIFCLLALATALNGLREPRRAAWWACAGFFTGLALLTKTPSLILLPFILSLIAAGSLRKPRTYLSFAIYLVLFVITVFALYPTLWVDPLRVVNTLQSLAGRHIETVQRPIFFAGRMIDDPGPAFYPVIFIFRVSPLVLIGLILGLVFLRRFPSERRFAFLLLLAFAVLFGAGMSLGAKKHDRYLLPAFPPLTLAATLGWEYLSGRMSKRWSSLTRLLILLAQLILALLFAAYPLTCYNPLLGGPHVAARLLTVGWGEGMGAAARHLNQMPDAPQLTVAAVSLPSFAPIFQGRAIPLNDAAVPLSDYIVTSAHSPLANLYPCHSHACIYTNAAPFEQSSYLAAHAGPDDLILLDADTPLARNDRYDGPGELLAAASLPNEIAVADWLAQQISDHEAIWLVASPGASPITAAHLRRRIEAVAAPVSTATVASAAITRFVPRSSPLSSHLSPYRAIFSSQLALVDSALPEAVAWPDLLQVTLRWQALSTPSTDHQIVAALRDGERRTWSTTESPLHNKVNFPTSAWTAGEWADATYALRLPPGIPPGRYTVEISLYDRATGAELGASGPDSVFQGTQVVAGEVTVTPPAAPPDAAALEMTERLGIPAGPLTLLGMDSPPAQVLSGDQLSFALFWQADAAPEADYRVCLRLTGSGNQDELEITLPLSPYPTSRWRSGDRFQSRYDLHVLPGLSPGHYNLTLDVLNPRNSVFGKNRVPLAAVDVLPRERSFVLPDEIPQRLDLAFGEKIHLRGYELTGLETTPGETLTLTLYWQADGPVGQDYTLFVHLLGADGLPHGQIDRTPGGGSAPTSSWAAGQVIVEQVVLPVAADAPPGSYRIAVGFYDTSYGDRLPATDASAQPLPDDQIILPLQITVTGDSQ